MLIGNIVLFDLFVLFVLDGHHEGPLSLVLSMIALVYLNTSPFPPAHLPGCAIVHVLHKSYIILYIT
jgi:hypothetical protein